MTKKHNKNYETEVKNEWRHNLWDYWRKWSGLKQIPKDKQYWTLGDRTIKEGIETGELHSIQNYGLLEDIKSFHTVNFEKEKAKDNLPPCRDCGKFYIEHDSSHLYIYGAGWKSYAGDIGHIVPILHHRGLFEPSLINLDTTHFSDHAYKLAAKICRYCPPGSFMAINMVYDRFCSRIKPESSILEYKQNRYLSTAKFHDPGIRYINGNCHLATIFLEF